MTEVQQYPNGHGGSLVAAPSPSPAQDFVEVLKEQVNQNPVSAALIGMGVLWMFMGGNSTTLFGGGGSGSVLRTAARSAGQLGGAVRDTAATVGSSVNEAAHRAADTAAHWSGAVSSTPGVTQDAISRGADQAGSTVKSLYGSTAQAASNTAETISGATTSAVQAVRETGTRWGIAAQRSIADLFAQQPLLLGAVGIAIGAGIAASIPTTEAEKSMMGDASGFVRDTVTQTAAEVKRMASAAVEEAQNQGLTPQAAGETLRSVGEELGAAAGVANLTKSATTGSRNPNEQDSKK